MNIGKAIKFKRKESGLTQEELSNGICSITYLSKLENGKLDSQINDETLNLLCSRLGISQEDLTSDSEELLDLLFEWYEKICEQDLSQSADLYNKVQKKISNSSNYETTIFFELFKLRYFIQKKDVGKSIKIHKDIEQKIDLYTPRQLYYYHKFLGYLYRERDMLEKSEHHLHKSIGLDQDLKINEPDLYYLLGIVQSRLGNYIRSFEYLHKAEVLYSDLIDYNKLFRINIIISINYILLGEYDLAIEKIEVLLQQAKKLKKEVNTIAMLKHNLGYAYFKKEKYQQSYNILLETLEMKEQSIGVSVDYLITYYVYVQAFLHLNMGEETEINNAIQEGISISDKLDNREYQIKFTYLYYKFSKNTAHVETLTFLENTALEYFSTRGDKDDYKYFLLEVVKIYKEKKMYKKATHYLLNYIEI
jgi:HTH-type transcriptional regulator, quorum sensing regulator NprR